jgi:hypothetical protein
MRHRTDNFEKLSRALQLHEQGVPTAAIGERLGISSREAARTIAQAKERRATVSSKL